MENIKDSQLYEIVKKVVSHYIDYEFTYDTNLLGITSVRNIIYILLELEKKAGLKIDNALIDELQTLSINNLVRLIPSSQAPPKYRFAEL